MLLSDLIRHRENSRKARASVLFWLRTELQALSAPAQIDVAQELVDDILGAIAELKRHNGINRSVGINADKPTLVKK